MWESKKCAGWSRVFIGQLSRVQLAGNLKFKMALSRTIPPETDSEHESTLNGDQTSYLSTSDTTHSSKTFNTMRMELERRQLLHTIQLLKLELNQKNMILDKIKTDSNSQIEELQETVMDVKCERNLLQQKLKAITQVYEVSSNK